MAEIKLAFDKKSVRTYDVDGRLHVSLTPISKANVCGYLGAEIPDEDGSLNLDPKKLYQLLRDPVELEKGANSSNGIQLLINKHIPVSTKNPQKESIVGSTGTDAVFQKPYLMNSLVVWDAVAIAGIESKEQTELSCGYRYKPDMTPGSYDGVAYDGVMRDIIFNHVAIVAQGRAGPDVVVGDEKPFNLETSMSKNITLSRKAAMAKGALAVFLKPKLANDAKIDLNAILAGVTDKNWQSKKAQIVQGVKVATKGKLAADASLADIIELVDSLDGEHVMDSPDDNLSRDADPDRNDEGAEDPNGTMNEAKDAGPMEKIRAFLKGKLSEEDLRQCEEMMKMGGDEDNGDADEMGMGGMDDEDGVIGQIKAMLAKLKAGKGANDEPPAFPGKPAAPQTSNKEKSMMPSKAAMDAMVSTAVKNAEKRVQDIAEAKSIVKPFIGEVKIAADSAEAIYRMALDNAGVNLDGVPCGAFKAMVGMLKTQATEKQPTLHLAHDSAAVSSFAKRFPAASKIKQLG